MIYSSPFHIEIEETGWIIGGGGGGGGGKGYFGPPSKIIGGSPVSTPMIYIMIINSTYAYRGSCKSQNGGGPEI